MPSGAIAIITPFNQGLLAGTAVRALPGILQAPVLLMAAGVSSIIESSRQKAEACIKANERSFVAGKLAAAVCTMDLIKEHRLAWLLPDAWLRFPELEELTWHDWLREGVGQRTSKGIESLYNPFFLPTKKAQEKVDHPPEGEDFRACLRQLQYYFHALATHTHLDSDSRRTAFITYQLLKAQIRLQASGEISLYQAWATAEATRKFIGATFMKGHQVNLYSETVRATCQQGSDNNFIRFVLGASLPTLPESETPLERMNRACRGIKNAFYASPVYEVFSVVKEGLLAKSQTMLEALLQKNGFAVPEGFDLVLSRDCQSRHRTLNAIYRQFDQLLGDRLPVPLDEFTDRLLAVAGTDARETSFAKSLAVIGTVASCAEAGSGRNFFNRRVYYTLHYLFENHIDRILQANGGIFDPNRNPSVDFGLQELFTRQIGDMKNDVASFHEYALMNQVFYSCEGDETLFALPKDKNEDEVVSFILQKMEVIKNELEDIARHKPKSVSNDSARIRYQIDTLYRREQLIALRKFLEDAGRIYDSIRECSLGPTVDVIRMQAQTAARNELPIMFLDKRVMLRQEIEAMHKNMVASIPAGESVHQQATAFAEAIRQQCIASTERAISHIEQGLFKTIVEKQRGVIQHYQSGIHGIQRRIKECDEEILQIGKRPRNLWQKMTGSRHLDERLRHLKLRRVGLTLQKDILSEVRNIESARLPQDSDAVPAHSSLLDVASFVGQGHAWPRNSAMLQVMMEENRVMPMAIRLSDYQIALIKHHQRLERHERLLEEKHRQIVKLQKGFFGAFWRVKCWFNKAYRDCLKDIRENEVKIAYSLTGVRQFDKAGLLAWARRNEQIRSQIFSFFRRTLASRSAEAAGEPVTPVTESTLAKRMQTSAAEVSERGMFGGSLHSSEKQEHGHCAPRPVFA